MKKYLYFTLTAVALLGLSTNFGCKKSAGDPPPNAGLGDTILVKMNGTVPVAAGGFSIRLDSVIGDSRCPTDVICFWEGRVDARFVFTKTATTATDTLANGAISATNWPDDKTNQFGYDIQLLKMTPHPTSIGPVPQSEYVAKLLVQPQ